MLGVGSEAGEAEGEAFGAGSGVGVPLSGGVAVGVTSGLTDGVDSGVIIGVSEGVTLAGIVVGSGTALVVMVEAEAVASWACTVEIAANGSTRGWSIRLILRKKQTIWRKSVLYCFMEWCNTFSI